MWVQFLSWEDPLEEGMATHSSILAWRIPWTDEPSGLHSPQGHTELDVTEATQHACMFYASVMFQEIVWKLRIDV